MNGKDENGKWIIVSNRLPFKIQGNGDQKLTASSGGLVTALSGVSIAQPLKWIGAFPADNAPLTWEKLADTSQKERYIPVFLDPEKYHQYYNGICNDILWPLFHYESRHYERASSQSAHKKWRSYEDVNESFAEKILSIAGDSDLIWIHDYHLFLLPGLLRKGNPKLRLGFFLHIPFPSSEVFRQLPMREEILRSLIEADLIGFHDYSYLRHFGASLYSVLGINSSSLAIDRKERKTQLGVFPVSIDSDKFSISAKSEEVRGLMRVFRQSSDYDYLILGVDRLDYTKGIKLKLLGFQEFLRRYPELQKRVRLLQVAVPSRTKSPEYVQLKSEIDELVGKINAEYGTINHVPVQYLFSSVSFHELLALYRMASVLMVTSKRDGLNLVSLEHVAASDPEDPGVLLLSEFAGCTSLLQNAIRINPWNFQEMADKLHFALHIPRQKRKDMHRPMLRFLLSYTASDWANCFMKKLAGCKPAQRTPDKVRLIDTGKEIENLMKQIGTKETSLLIDANLLLGNHQEDSARALKSNSIWNLLTVLGLRGRKIVLIGARSAEFYESALPQHDFSLAAENGALFYSGGKWQELVHSNEKTWYGPALNIMEDFASRTPGSSVESREFSLCWSFESSPRDFGDYQARKLMVELEDALASLPVKVSSGPFKLDVSSIEADREHFINWYKSTYHGNSNALKGTASIVYIGCDPEAQVVYKTFDKEDISIGVGNSMTNSSYRLANGRELARFLQVLKAHQPENLASEHAA